MNLLCAEGKDQSLSQFWADVHLIYPVLLRYSIKVYDPPRFIFFRAPIKGLGYSAGWIQRTGSLCCWQLANDPPGTWVTPEPSYWGRIEISSLEQGWNGSLELYRKNGECSPAINRILHLSPAEVINSLEKEGISRPMDMGFVSTKTGNFGLFASVLPTPHLASCTSKLPTKAKKGHL